MIDEAEIDQLLAELLDLHLLAGTQLTPGTSGELGALGARRDPPLPLNLDALDLALGDGLLATLEAWEVWWREVYGLRGYGRASEARLRPSSATVTSQTLRGVVGFLRAWWPQASRRETPSPEDFADEVRGLHRAAMAALALTRFDIDPEAVEPFDWAILCPRDIDDQGTMCGHRIGMRRRPLPVDGLPQEPLTLNCEKCGAHWDSARLLLVSAAAGTRVEVSVNDAMAHFGVSRATVYRMVASGKVQRGAHGRIALGGSL